MLTRRLRRLRRLLALDLAVLAAATAAALTLTPASSVTRVVVSSDSTSAATRVAGDSADHAFLYTVAGQPVAFPTCRAVHYRVNAAGAPKDGGRDVAEALQRISAVTGLRFVRDGRTTVLPGNGSFVGWGTTDLVIGWSTAATRPALGGNVLGVGGVQVTGSGGEWEVSRGFALFDAVDMARYPAGWGLGAVGALYAHELGHAVGLGHAASGPEVMYGRLSGTSTSTYQRGDLAGLQALARAGAC